MFDCGLCGKHFKSGRELGGHKSWCGGGKSGENVTGVTGVTELSLADRRLASASDLTENVTENNNNYLITSDTGYQLSPADDHSLQQFLAGEMSTLPGSTAVVPAVPVELQPYVPVVVGVWGWVKAHPVQTLVLVLAAGALLLYLDSKSRPRSRQEVALPSPSSLIPGISGAANWLAVGLAITAVCKTLDKAGSTYDGWIGRISTAWDWMFNDGPTPGSQSAKRKPGRPRRQQ